jgi:D-alanyl-D-alanine carboxypeptidase (penicillin-binding protein 5/6)
MLTTSPLEGVLFSGYSPSFTSNTKDIVDEEVLSEYAVLIDLDTGEVVAQRRAKDKMYPASMTKVLTVLVAAEHVPSLTDRFAMTRDITNYCYSNDCSAVCWDVGEKIPVSDLFYGSILPSGADAVLGLCQVSCGSTADFVDLMNQKVADLGLTHTHFDNPIGLFSEDTYTTPTEMAMLMKAAIENGTAYDALSAHIHTTLPTAEHPDGLTLSNLFLRRIEDHFDKGEVVCAKTGFVNQSLNCAVSYCKSNEGKHYVCVTGKVNGAWKCIYDHVRIYNTYLP